MSLFGNNTLKNIFYVFTIVIVFCVSFKLRERLDLYIKNIPEEERNFCHKFLDNAVVQIMLFAGLGFVLLKFKILSQKNEK